MQLTSIIHEKLKTYITKDDFLIDATVGNGHDTTFLALHGKRVIGFDIQKNAIDMTERLLVQKDLLHRVNLFQMSHEFMSQLIPHNWIGNVKIIMFNLGYLPGGDKAIITKPSSTLKALEQSLILLAPNGHLSIGIYPGHSGGQEEAENVINWIKNLSQLDYQIKSHGSSTNSLGPIWYLVSKKMF